MSTHPSPSGSRKRRQAPRLPRPLRGRVAALGIVAALMVALPLSLLLRRQQTELDQLAARRAVLDPIARSVDAQRSLLQHRDAAGQVLRGQPKLEPQRRVVQGEVDKRLVALAVALDVGPWERVVQESDALRGAWSLLARRVIERSLRADESDDGHGLLIDQTLQIIDLLDLAGSGRAVAQAASTSRPRAVPTPAALQAEGLLIDERAAAIRLERRLLLAAMLLLTLLALRLARPVRVVAEPSRSQPEPPAQAVEAGRLFDRLRRKDNTPSELPPDSRIGDVRQP